MQDNKDHYEVLADEIATELTQVVKVGPNFKFNPTSIGIIPNDVFKRTRGEAEQDEVEQQKAWNALLELKEWQVQTQLMIIDLSHGTESIFREIAPSSQKNINIKWHNREVTGRVLMRDLLDIGKRGAMLPSINSSDTGNDFMVYISSTVASDQVEKLIASKKDPRILIWSPDELSNLEQNLLLDFAAYRIMVREYAGRDSQDAKIVLDWVQSRLRDQMGQIYRIVPDSYGRGRINSLEHSQFEFTVQGELTSILTPLVAKVLDDTYISKEQKFTAPAAFNDTNAINVINGIVKVGEIPRGAKPNRYISAAQNYGFDLQIMRRPNDKKLDLRDCRYTQAIGDWIENKLIDSTATMPINTIEKNFMGIGGPNNVNYGLSRRMVQLYLLCLLRDGKIRISLSGRSAPVETIDYTNIADIDFKTSVLDAFDQIQRLKPPEGWDLLAPFAAILLEDESVRSAKEDADIRAAIQNLLDFKEKKQEEIKLLQEGLADLFEEIGGVNPLDEHLDDWGKFLTSQVDKSDPIPYLRSALDKGFGYHIYQEDNVRQAELDDLKSRCLEIQQANDFYKHQDRIRAAARYTDLELPDEPMLTTVQKMLAKAKACFKEIKPLMVSEAKLRSDLLDPMEEAILTYSVRYLQVFDQVTARTEETRQGIRDLRSTPTYRAVERLASLRQLGENPIPKIEGNFESYLDADSALFPVNITKANVERELRSWPYPPGCPLTLQNSFEWLEIATESMIDCQNIIDGSLGDKAALLQSDALRERLAQGKDHDFIAGLLRVKTIEQIRAYLTQTLGGETVPEPNPIELLNRYLTKIRVHKLNLSDFHPSKRTIEEEDVDQVVEEFETFIRDGLHVGGDELPVIELE